MALIRWYDRGLDPAESYDWLQQQINELFDVPRTYESQGVFDRASSPAVDVIERPDAFVVRCDLPGVGKEELDISIAAGVLSIKGEKRLHPSEKAKVYKKETWEGTFQRTIALPTGVESDRVEATYKDGVLSVVVPKKEEIRPRRIELKAR